ncbi:hypothetical protein NPIL_528381 [Nephila pilipes]|uniref:Uncharacterized protein n=1 Tax=Nephila pilipes TaxID=299642 RepID=A0A8X6QSN0_NEPPI|nr:hypothetical protein NPIL_528381 [Nephila pilipes]
MAREAKQNELEMKKLELSPGNPDQKNEPENRFESSHKIQLTHSIPKVTAQLVPSSPKKKLVESIKFKPANFWCFIAAGSLSGFLASQFWRFITASGEFTIDFSTTLTAVLDGTMNSSSSVLHSTLGALQGVCWISLGLVLSLFKLDSAGLLRRFMLV